MLLALLHFLYVDVVRPYQLAGPLAYCYCAIVYTQSQPHGVYIFHQKTNLNLDMYAMRNVLVPQ